MRVLANRRLVLFGIGCVMSAGLAVAPDSMASAPLPAGTVVFDSNRTGNYELFSMNSDGTSQTQLTSNAAYDSWWPKPSPDRTKILFVRTPAGVHDTNYGQVSTWVMNSDGTGLTQLMAQGAFGWTIQGHPEWSPDGTKIATVGGPSNNSQIYIVNADGTNPVRITNNGSGGNRGGTNIDPSWKPDGQYLLFIGCPQAFCLTSGYEVYRIKTDGTGTTRLTTNSQPDYDPYYSPNTTGFPGTGTIAWLANTGSNRWGIKKMNPNGTAVSTVIDDGGINSKPAWSLDSSTIFFHRLPVGGSRFNIWKILPSGVGLTQVITPTPAYVNEYPVNGIN